METIEVLKLVLSGVIIFSFIVFLYVGVTIYALIHENQRIKEKYRDYMDQRNQSFICFAIKIEELKAENKKLKDEIALKTFGDGDTYAVYKLKDDAGYVFCKSNSDQYRRKEFTKNKIIEWRIPKNARLYIANNYYTYSSNTKNNGLRVIPLDKLNTFIAFVNSVKDTEIIWGDKQ